MDQCSGATSSLPSYGQKHGGFEKQTSVRDLNVELDAKDLLDTSGLGLHVSLAMTVMGGKDAAAATEQLRRRWTDSTALSLMG